ncbi:hypothetical protein ALO43_200314 [Pseudomonas tremae]|uniref:Penicillin amidase family protein n=1 Tax=Pseudomonas tremae TaxID=200454 RepID=A0AA40P0T8_9PSED|nr:hypothetical protein ALO43_200314 [Pseudomonas tremae]
MVSTVAVICLYRNLRVESSGPIRVVEHEMLQRFFWHVAADLIQRETITFALGYFMPSHICEQAVPHQKWRLYT